MIMHVSVGIVIGILLLSVIISLVAKRPSALSEERLELQNRESQYRRLLARVLGDNQAADRLIEYERQHSPSATESELIRKAIDRLEYDRGH